MTRNEMETDIEEKKKNRVKIAEEKTKQNYTRPEVVGGLVKTNKNKVKKSFLPILRKTKNARKRRDAEEEEEEGEKDAM